MSTLRSALDELKLEDLRHRCDRELLDDLGELERTARALEAERARRIAEVERRGACAADDGYLSVTAWLIHRLGTPASTARSQVRLGRALERMPATRSALSEGEIPLAAARLLSDAHRAAPGQFERSEEVLVELARTLPVRDLVRVVEHWRHLADAAAAEAAAERRFSRRGLYVSPMLDGITRGRRRPGSRDRADGPDRDRRDGGCIGEGGRDGPALTRAAPCGCAGGDLPSLPG